MFKKKLINPNKFQRCDLCENLMSEEIWTEYDKRDYFNFFGLKKFNERWIIPICLDCIDIAFFNYAPRISVFQKKRTIISNRDKSVKILKIDNDIHKILSIHKDRKEMIKDIVNLVSIIGFVPEQKFKHQLLKTKFNDFKLEIKIVKHLRYMLPFRGEDIEKGDILTSTYMDFFGSWLKATLEAGVLEGNVRKNFYGTMCVSKDGHDCNSLSEKRIDDWLYERGLKHDKEPKYPFDDKLNKNGNLRADWKVGIYYIEYFGLAGNDEYEKKIKLKEKLCIKNKLKLVPIYYSDMINLNKKLSFLLKR